MTKEALKAYLSDHEYSCVLLKDGQVWMTSFEKGITPLYQFIKTQEELPQGKLEIGDKMIGRAVAFLALYLNVSYIYTRVISETALEVLAQYPIEVVYDEVVPYIYNRNRDGQCPMEEALAEIVNVKEAFEIIDLFKKRQKQAR